MKKILAAVALMATMFAALPAAAQNYTLRIENLSGVTLYRLYATPRSWDNYGQDLLGNRVLNNRSIMPLTFSNVQECLYDFKFEFIEGSVIYDSVNLCNVGTYTITP
ncbi:hypothetical protein [Pseudoroseicyclus sp. CXY001]|uniref:hypothetical protein n=1 Tax=Pseudoroseicyclus sp. CXY001 TaxID=3242492 RepID=UPI003570E047